MITLLVLAIAIPLTRYMYASDREQPRKVKRHMESNRHYTACPDMSGRSYDELTEAEHDEIGAFWSGL